MACDAFRFLFSESESESRLEIPTLEEESLQKHNGIWSRGEVTHVFLSRRRTDTEKHVNLAKG